MPINDNSPERKNLVILSISIILFYLAGGSFTDDSIRLQIINIHFTNPSVLVKTVWFLLIWFCYRYWLVMQGSWVEPFHQEVDTDKLCRAILYKYLIKRFHISLVKGEPKETHFFILFQLNRYKENISFTHIRGGIETDRIKKLNLTDKLIIFICGLYLFFRKPALSTYIFPYLLFLYAIYLGITNAITKF